MVLLTRAPSFFYLVWVNKLIIVNEKLKKAFKLTVKSCKIIKFLAVERNNNEPISSCNKS